MLTKAQRKILRTADERDGIACFGPLRQSERVLLGRGYLTVERDKGGYRRITEAGRRALQSEERDTNGEARP